MLENMLHDFFGSEEVNKTNDILEAYFKKDIQTLRQYFQLIDATVAEMYQTDHPDIRKFQRQECFILANNFVGPETIHADIFVSRVLAPTFHMVENAKLRKDKKLEHSLKYLQVTFHDTNLSNLLRFLKYFDTYGFQKFVRFSSSLRFELLRNVNDLNDDEHDNSEYRMRVVFDNEELQLPFCQELYCTYDEFKNYLTQNLIFDYQQVDQYCEGGMGNEYVNELKFK